MLIHWLVYLWFSFTGNTRLWRRRDCSIHICMDLTSIYNTLGRYKDTEQGLSKRMHMQKRYIKMKENDPEIAYLVHERRPNIPFCLCMVFISIRLGKKINLGFWMISVLRWRGWVYMHILNISRMRYRFDFLKHIFCD